MTLRRHRVRPRWWVVVLKEDDLIYKVGPFTQARAHHQVDDNPYVEDLCERDVIDVWVTDEPPHGARLPEWDYLVLGTGEIR